MPLLVVHLSPDGIVLHANPEALKVTGYAESDLLGKNFWALLFPGRLFAQVPKFISALHPLQILANEVPMTLRTRSGEERTIAWTRVVHDPGTPDTASPSLLCVGTDLTNRLLDADKLDLPAAPTQAPAEPDPLAAFGPIVAGAECEDGDFVTPIAIVPPPPTAEPGVPPAIEQVHAFLTEIDGRIAALETAYSEGEWNHLADIAATLRNGAHVCGLLDFCTRAERLRVASTSRELHEVTALVEDIVKICRPDGSPRP